MTDLQGFLLAVLVGGLGGALVGALVVAGYLLGRRSG